MSKKIISILAIGLIILGMVGCTRNSLSNSEREYYKGLAESKIKLGDTDIENYISIYVTYSGHMIPEDKLEVIKKLTDEQYYESTVRNVFINTMSEEARLDVNEGIPPEGVAPPEEQTAGDNQVEPAVVDDESKAQVLDIFYVYKDNTYVAKIMNDMGKVNFLFFRVNEQGKVVDIHG